MGSVHAVGTKQQIIHRQGKEGFNLFTAPVMAQLCIGHILCYLSLIYLLLKPILPINPSGSGFSWLLEGLNYFR